jgi:hypothetical protein
MNNTMLWIGLGIGIVAIFTVLEVLLRTLFNKYGTSQFPHRTGTELPRVLNK